MPRVTVYYRPDRFRAPYIEASTDPIIVLHGQVLRRLQEVVARTFSTEQGPVIAEEVQYKVWPYLPGDGPMHDVDLIITAYPFPDRLAIKDQIAGTILSFVNSMTDSHITVGVWIDWSEITYVEFPDRTR